MKKRTILFIISILFINLLIVSSCSLNKNSEGLEFTINELNCYSITGIGVCKDVDIVIPNKYKGKPVIAIEKAAFASSEIESITIPDSVTFIGAYAFQKCKKLKSVKFSNSLRYISVYSFFSCTSLESIEIPNSVTDITLGAFEECTNLKAVTFDEGSQLASIGDRAFASCTSLISVTIPQGVTSISSRSFMNCSSLENVYYGGKIEDWCNMKLEDTPMKYAKHFYMLNENNEYYEVIELVMPNTITKIGQYQFYGFNNITKVTIPNSVKSIGEYAFFKCTNLESIEIPNSVKSIGQYAFKDCPNLIIYCETTSMPDSWYINWNPDNRPVVWGFAE